MKRPTEEVRIIDALCLLSPQSGASDDHCRGVIMGIISTLMAFGYDYKQAIATIDRLLPTDFRLNGIPKMYWKDVSLPPSAEVNHFIKSIPGFG